MDVMNHKPTVSFVAIGPCNSGKSTLVGHLMAKLGYVDNRTLEKFSSDSAQLGKPSYKYAWIMDKLKAERERGISVKNSRKHFETENRNIIITTTPGHTDYLNNLIKAITHVDYAILVVSAEHSHDQAREEVLCKLAYFLGCKQLIVVVNKMDDAYDEAKFQEIKSDISARLKRYGWNTDRVPFLPISAWIGENLTEKSFKMPWYHGWQFQQNDGTTRRGQTLLDVLNNVDIPERDMDKPLRISVQDVTKVSGVGTVAVGRLESGVLRLGMSINFAPSKIVSNVNLISKFGTNVEVAYAGETVGFNIKNVATMDLQVSFVASNLHDQPARAVKSFVAQVVVLDHPGAIKVGYAPVLFCHHLHVSCKFEELRMLIDRQTKAFIKSTPLQLKPNDSAIVKLVPKNPVCVEKFSDYPQLGRFVMIDLKRIVVAGIIKEVEYLSD